VHVHLDAVVGDENAAGDALAVDAKVVAFPLRGEPQLAAELVGDLVDAPPRFLGAETMFTFDFQCAAIG
jgi:hypothetical protein